MEGFLMLDTVSYLLGKQKGEKTTTVDVDTASISYDTETKTVTMTVEGGDSQ